MVKPAPGPIARKSTPPQASCLFAIRGITRVVKTAKCSRTDTDISRADQPIVFSPKIPKSPQNGPEIEPLSSKRGASINSRMAEAKTIHD
ncbi:hypothetical protein Ciccas_011464 [Cichlidogyrus casuarinus]|uniref:Uncharacterized protein n=1 Tax=Cichlidogyrus casuarinus TaxID=1844966 RepID=A0ABD2PR63_9PLAT